MAQQVSSPNVVLFLALSYLCFDLVADWGGCGRCPKPVHKWLLASYVLLALLLAVGLLATILSSGQAGHFLLHARPKGAVMKLIFSATWLVLVPLFTAWSALGTVWAWDVVTRAPDCVPSSMHLAFLVVWQVVSWAWIIFYVGMGAMSSLAERRVRRAEQDLRDLEDPDVVARWGHIGTLDGYTSLPAQMAKDGLTPAQIRRLPGVVARTHGHPGLLGGGLLHLLELHHGGRGRARASRLLPRLSQSLHRPLAAALRGVPALQAECARWRGRGRLVTRQRLGSMAEEVMFSMLSSPLSSLIRS